MDPAQNASPPEPPASRGFVWLDSATAPLHGDSGDAHSILGMHPQRWVTGNLWNAPDYAALEAIFRENGLPAPSLERQGEPQPRLTGLGFGALVPEEGALLGVIGYDGEFTLGLYRDLLVYHHAMGSWSTIGAPVDLWGNSRDARHRLHHRLDENAPPLEVAQHLYDQAEPSVVSRLEFQPGLTPAQYMALVERAREYIAAGDIYQVNLSQQFSAQFPAGQVDAFALYQHLRASSPAPMAAFMELPDGRAVLSASMETFLTAFSDEISTSPIKGTRPRGRDAAGDAAALAELRSSPKERAELVMITDLERNDLGQVCEFGTVEVTEFLQVAAYAQVFHQYSTVTGQLRREVSHLEALRACFPGGSITGAPKKRAREIIAELEPVPRGLYTGALGYFGLGADAASQWNIAIRTMTIDPPDAAGTQNAQFHVGAGIVADSEPAAEHEETLHKAAGLLQAAQRYGAERKLR